MMKPFLLELAEELNQTYGRELESLTLVFPNRRAALYFRKHLSTLLTRPSFAPTLLTVEEFIAGYSTSLVPDKLELIHRLYSVYYNVLKQHSSSEIAEPFDQFYFWGEMLLRDFDEIDKYLVNAEHLFKDLSNLKELDAGFDFLTDEQRKFLQSFWNSFDEKDSANKSRFLYVWRQLFTVYSAFRTDLAKEHLAYDGMLHREVAERIEFKAKVGNSKARNLAITPSAKPVLHFVGFNALTKAEEKIIEYFVSANLADVWWDIDSYYLNNSVQEAGKFFRQYQQHPVLGKTFRPDVPSNFKKLQKIFLYGASQPIGQAKLMAHLLEEKLGSGSKPEETLVVLPDEKLIMPVLHGVTSTVEKLNVTMGFPLTSAPLFNLIELVIELHINRGDEFFNHKQVLAILGHPYVVAADAAAAHLKRKEIIKKNWVSVPIFFLRSEVQLHRILFDRVTRDKNVRLSPIHLTAYLKEVITEIGSQKKIQALDREFCFHFIKLLNQLERIVDTGESGTSPEPVQRKDDRRTLKSFLRLFRQLVRMEKIPFRGEPLQGLQIMGVLETRNLDFKNVFVLSMNEGAFPSFNSRSSYVPMNIRKAYGLPIPDHQDSIYSYLFYRVLQRAENVYLFHNTETDELGQGELSRYIRQLMFESGIPIEAHTLHNELKPLDVKPLVVEKDESVFTGLAQFVEGNAKGKSLSPSALNDYLECRLRFYFKYVAGIKEANEVEDDLDARVLGNFLHRVMEKFYRHILDTKRSSFVEPGDFINAPAIDQFIDEAFIEKYSLPQDQKVVYEGQRLVVKEIVKRFVGRILELDKEYAPFTIEALERRDIEYKIKLEAHGSPVVVLGGSIDRADRKDDKVRIIDYKTGKDDIGFADVQSLFNREGKRNKAAFQTMLYALLFLRRFRLADRIVPGLMNRVNLFNDDYEFGLKQGGRFMTDAAPLLPDFEQMVIGVLNELYDPSVPFDQTQQEDNCRFCSYKRICYR